VPKKDPTLFDGSPAEANEAVLGMIVTIAARKKLQRKRAEDVLKPLLERPPWIAVALGNAELLAELREFASLCGSEPMKALLEPPAPAPAPRPEPAPGPEPDPPGPEPAPKDTKDPQERMNVGLEVMKSFDFRFPRDPLGTKLDDATRGFQSFFDGVTWCYAGWGKELLGTQGLGPYETYGKGILDFCVSMYETPGRAAFKGRTKFVVLKLAELSPAFAQEVRWYVDEHGRMPWDPVPDAPSEEPPTVSGMPKSVRLGVVWIDFKMEAYTTSTLNSQDNICFAGFHDDDTAESYQPREEWLGHILDRVEDPYNRVAVVILNKRHQQALVDIRGHCAKCCCQPPVFVVVTRKGSEGQFRDWGISDRCITTDWKQVPGIVNLEIERA